MQPQRMGWNGNDRSDVTWHHVTVAHSAQGFAVMGSGAGTNLNISFLNM